MRRRSMIFCWIAIWVAIAISSHRAIADQSIWLSAPQQKRLVELVQNDPVAAALYGEYKRAADRALTSEPNPIDAILTEGKLPQDPAKLKTEASLGDMPKIGALGYVFVVSADAKYADKAREFILAWARTNHSAGDPIDDTNLEPLIVTYDLTRYTFSPDERAIVDRYLREVVAAELATAKSKKNNHYNNWHSHRLKIVGLIAFTLHDQALIDETARLYKEQIDHNIEADGSTYDFHERDALHYHIYDIAPLLTLAIVAHNNGVDLYSYRSASGATLKIAVDFLLPYARGIKTHAEFVNSKVSFDRKRAEAGAKAYQAGSPFQPGSATSILAVAEFFDPSLLELVQTLSHKPAQKYPSWQSVLNAVWR
ncbi:MAG TPA: alginate lyase family protein [Pirellulales bacterium]